MANISITVADADLTRALNSACVFLQYQDTLPSGAANPETKAQFVRRKIAETLKSWAIAGEVQAANATATASANQISIS